MLLLIDQAVESDNHDEFCGSNKIFIAPECRGFDSDLSNERDPSLAAKADIWSLGMILYMLIMQDEQIKSKISGNLKYMLSAEKRAHYPKELVQFIDSCL